MIGIQALHKGPKISHAHPGGTCHMHQRQPASGYQPLNGAQGNTELLSGFALGYQQSPGHIRRIQLGASAGQALARAGIS
jgi:hypothetical protein